jgi:hypothetical protein
VLALHEFDGWALGIGMCLVASWTTQIRGNWRFGRTGGVIFMLGRRPDFPPASEQWGFIEHPNFSSTAPATQAAFRR